MKPDHTPRSRSPRWLRVITSAALLLLLGSLMIAPPVKAATVTATIAIASFDGENIKGFKLNGDATRNNSDLRLTPASEWQAGSAFWTNRVSLANQRSFSTYFIINMSGAGGSPSGADGIVFTIQTQSNTAGSAGGGIGYDGITPSIGIEFDSFQNTFETNDNHVGFDINGNVRDQTHIGTPPGSLKENTWHVWIDYNGATKLLQVRMNSINDRDVSPRLEVTRDIASDIGQDVFVGFTAATGGSYENHDIKALYFVNDYAPIDTRPTSGNTYSQAPSSVTVSPSSTSIAAGGSSTITITVRDPAGNVMANQPVTLSTSLGTLSATSGTTDANGQIVITLNGGWTGGTATIRATAAGGVIGTTTVAVSAPTTSYIYIPLFWQRQ